MWRKLALSTWVGLLTLTAVAAEPPLPRREPPPIPRQEREYRDRDGRQVWRYSANGGGTFNHMRGRKWMEYRNAGEPVPFREVTRTQDYVELFDDARQLPVRLYPDKCYLNLEGQGWAVCYEGRWE